MSNTTIAVPASLANEAAALADRLKPHYPQDRLSTAAIVRALTASGLRTRVGLSTVERSLADRLEAANTAEPEEAA